MPDNDLQILEDAAAAAFAVDKAYRKAVNDNDLNAMLALRPKADAANGAYADARRKLLQAGVMATDADVAEMRRIKARIDAAADTQQVLAGAAELVGLLAKFV